MTLRYPHRLLWLWLAVAGQLHAATDEKGNAVSRPWKAGFDLGWAGHNEAGLDRSKGEYDVSYNTLGGFLSGQYRLPDFYLHGGIGLMRLMTLRVNSVAMAMENRTQWHVPVFLHAYYPIDPVFAFGAGISHLTETTMYLNGTAVPKSSYNHLFIDLAMQFSPKLSRRVNLVFTFVFGINMFPGRQNVYTVTDLLHVRAQLTAGLQYLLF